MEPIEDLQLTNLLAHCLAIISIGEQFDMQAIAAHAEDDGRASDAALSAIQILNEFIGSIPKHEKPNLN